jgi:hypothetical protein
MDVFTQVIMKNAAAMKTGEVKELLKNRGSKQGDRNVGKDVLLKFLRDHAQKTVEVEKLATMTFDGAKAELKALGKVVPAKMKIGGLRELVKQAAAEAAEAEAQAAAAAAVAAKEAAAAAAAAKDQVEAQEAEAVEQAGPGGPAGPAGTPKRKRKHESVESALSPVKISKADVRKAQYKGEKKKEATRKQMHKWNHVTIKAEYWRRKKMGAKTAGKKQRLDFQQNAYDLRPGLGENIEIGVRFAVGEIEETKLTWFALAHVMSSAPNRQLHPGIKEAAQCAWMPSTSVFEQAQRDAQAAAFGAAYRAGAQQELESDSDV